MKPIKEPARMSRSRDLNHLMRSIEINEQRLYLEKTSSYNLSPSQARALMYIEDHAGSNQKEIADYFHLRGASTSTLIKKLEDRGYVEKRPSRGSQDRSNKLYLTAEGKKLSTSLNGTFNDVENLLVKNLTDEEADTLIQLLSKINQGFGE